MPAQYKANRLLLRKECSIISAMDGLSINGLLEYAVGVRRALHAIPELSGCEYETSAYVRARLEELGYAVRAVHTGLIADVPGGSGGIVALRADFDALPITERTGLPFAASCGRMHACGHDGHTAMLLAAAKAFAARPPKRRVRLIFQFGEEGEGGAEKMIEGGALDGVTEIYALHLCPELEKGKLATNDGTLFAGVMEFDADIAGRSSHCASPETGADAVMAAARFVVESKRIAESGGGALMHTGRAEAGSARNIVADRAHLECSFRYFDKGRLAEVRDELKELLARLDGEFGTRSGITVHALYPPLVSDARCVRKMRALAGAEHIDGRYTAEDFAFYAEKVPGCMCWLGIRDENHTSPLHSDTFDFDESVMAKGIETFVALGDAESIQAGDGDAVKER